MVQSQEIREIRVCGSISPSFILPFVDDSYTSISLPTNTGCFTSKHSNIGKYIGVFTKSCITKTWDLPPNSAPVGLLEPSKVHCVPHGVVSTRRFTGFPGMPSTDAAPASKHGYSSGVNVNQQMGKSPSTSYGQGHETNIWFIMQLWSVGMSSGW